MAGAAARRRGGKVVIQVMDSGIGIPSSKFRTIFKEFARLDEGARTASGLGTDGSVASMSCTTPPTNAAAK